MTPPLSQNASPELNFASDALPPNQSHIGVSVGGSGATDGEGELGARRVLARLRTHPCAGGDGGGLRSLSGFEGHVENLVFPQPVEGLCRMARAPVMTWLSPLFRDIVDRG